MRDAFHAFLRGQTRGDSKKYVFVHYLELGIEFFRLELLLPPVLERNENGRYRQGKKQHHEKNVQKAFVLMVRMYSHTRTS